MSKPLAIDLFCGLGGFTEGLLAEGYSVVGFDIEQHVYGEHRYPAQLVLQDVLTLHGSQFRDAVLIVASPPCQEFSYMAMPWSIAKEKQRRIEADPEERKRLTALFEACFRIQREACAAAGRHIPLVVENVRGAQKWVGRSRWNFGSFHLWGDVPALMPMTAIRGVMKQGIAHRTNGATNFHGYKTVGHMNIRDGHSHTRHLTNHAETLAAKISDAEPGVKIHGSGHAWYREGLGRVSSGSSARKAASAMIAKIPFVLSRYIAQVYKP